MTHINQFRFCKYNLILITFAEIFFANLAFANKYEMGMQITSDGVHLVPGVPVYLYRISDLSAPYRQAVSGSGSGGVYDNVICDIADAGVPNTDNPTWPVINIGDYYVRVGSDYIKLVIGPTAGSGDFEIVYNGYKHTFTYIDKGRGPDTYLSGSVTQWNISTVSVAVNQLLDDNITQTGTLKRWTCNSFDPLIPLGQIFDMSENVAQVLRADQNIQTGEKYNNWSVTNVTQSDITNHHSFMITQGIGSLVSHFATANDATIQSQLLDGGSPGAKLNFLDPWFIDTTDSYGQRNQGMSDWPHPVDYNQNNIGINSSHKGVFLNQLVTSGVYYTVRAPLIQTNINGFTGYFQNWSYDPNYADLQQVGNNPDGYDQKAVVFKQAGATVTASYKAHLGSSISTVTGSNSQRKITGIWNPVYYRMDYYIVYESDGDIWFCSSQNGGATWSDDKMISAGNRTAHNASISQAPGGYAYSLYIFWVDKSSTNLGYSVYECQFNASTSSWGNIEEVGGPPFSLWHSKI